MYIRTGGKSWGDYIWITKEHDTVSHSRSALFDPNNTICSSETAIFAVLHWCHPWSSSLATSVPVSSITISSQQMSTKYPTNSQNEKWKNESFIPAASEHIYINKPNMSNLILVTCGIVLHYWAINVRVFVFFCLSQSGKFSFWGCTPIWALHPCLSHNSDYVNRFHTLQSYKQRAAWF